MKSKLEILIVLNLSTNYLGIDSMYFLKHTPESTSELQSEFHRDGCKKLGQVLEGNCQHYVQDHVLIKLW